MLILFLTSQPHEKIGSLGLYNFWCLVLANLCTVVEKIVGPLGIYFLGVLFLYKFVGS